MSAEPPPPHAPRRRPLPAMRTVDRAVGLLVAAFGVVVLLASRGLAYTSPFGPGPGFLPTWLGVALIGCGALLAVSRLVPARPEAAGEPLDLPDRAGLARVSSITLALLASALLLERLGFLLTAGLLVLFAVLIIARRPALAVALAIGLPLAFYVVFAAWLGVPLPAGPPGG